MRRVFAVVLLCVFGLVAGTSPAFAQATGAVTGQVTDESGAVLPGCVDRTHKRCHRADADGSYRKRWFLPDPARAAGTLHGEGLALLGSAPPSGRG